LVDVEASFAKASSALAERGEEVIVEDVPPGGGARVEAPEELAPDEVPRAPRLPLEKAVARRELVGERAVDLLARRVDDVFELDAQAKLVRKLPFLRALPRVRQSPVLPPSITVRDRFFVAISRSPSSPARPRSDRAGS
jgi:hypothetical protein